MVVRQRRSEEDGPKAGDGDDFTSELDARPRCQAALVLVDSDPGVADARGCNEKHGLRGAWWRRSERGRAEWLQRTRR